MPWELLSSSWGQFLFSGNRVLPLGSLHFTILNEDELVLKHIGWIWELSPSWDPNSRS
jgi:hypothetical protein